MTERKLDIDLGADATRMKRGMDEAATAVGKFGKDAELALKTAGDKGGDHLEQGVRSGVQGATDVLDRTGKEGGDKFADGVGRGADTAANNLADGARSGTNTAAELIDRFGKEAARILAEAGDKGGSSFADGVAKGGKDAGSGLEGLLGGAPLKAGIAGAALALGAVALKGFMTGMANEAESDKVRATLVPGEHDMKEAGEVAARVYAGAWGESLAEVEGMVAELLQNGVASADLEPLTQQVADIATAFDQDFVAVIESGRQMVNNGLVPDMASAFDVITRGFQMTGATGREELLEVLNEYSDSFQQLGIDGPTAIALIDKALDAGAFNIDKIGDGIKEFSIRAIDGSEATALAFEALGMDAEEMGRKLAEGGPTAQKAFGEVVEAIGSISDPLKQEAVGVALFGTVWEDLGGDVVTAMSPAKVAIGDISTAAEDMGAVLNDNLATDIEAFKRKSMQGISDAIYNTALPAVDALRGAFADGGLGGVINMVGDEIKGGLDDLGGWLNREGWSILGRFFTDTLPRETVAAMAALGKLQFELGMKVLGLLGDGLVAAWPTVRGWLGSLPGLAVDAIGSLGSTLLAKGVELVVGLAAGITDRWAALDAWLVGLGPRVVAAVPGLAATLVGKGVELLTGFAEGMSQRWGTLRSWLVVLGGSVLRAIPGLAATLVTKGFELLSGFAVGISNRWVALSAWFRDLPGVVLRTAPGLAATLVAKGFELLSGFAVGMSDRWANLSAWFRALPGVIVSAIGDLGRALYAKGQDLLQGFIDGVKSKAGSVATAVASAIPIPGAGIAARAASSTISSIGGMFRHAGGPVPGPAGRDRLMMVKGGEHVLTASDMAAVRRLATTGGGGRGGTVTYTNVIELHGPATLQDGQRVVAALQEYQSQQGPIPIRTAGVI